MFNNLDDTGVIRQKLNNLFQMMSVAVTDVDIAAGTVTSIPITDISTGVLFSGNDVYLENFTTGELTTLSIAADYISGDNHLTVSSIVLSDIPSGSIIYFGITNILYKFL